jgi:hypothetical protein
MRDYYGPNQATRPEQQQSVPVPSPIPAHIDKAGAMRAYRKFHGALGHKERIDAAEEFGRMIHVTGGFREIIEILHGQAAKDIFAG